MAARSGGRNPETWDARLGAMIYAWIAAGSALGGMARYWLGGLIDQRIGETFPWGTIVVNISGSIGTFKRFSAGVIGQDHISL